MSGRSNRDVYPGGPDGLHHYDGKAWSAVDFGMSVLALVGDAKGVYVLTVKR